MMEAKIYNSQEWRELPRDGECVVSFLFGERAGPCHGLIDRHHVNPPDERSVQVCHRHHPMLESARRRLFGEPRWKSCPHIHRTREARESCERRLNRDLVAA
jgi:hypothetical protein